jgi:hypothetical protein
VTVTPETVEAGPGSDQHEGAAEDRPSLTELAERLGRDVGVLLQREAELSAARNRPALRRLAAAAVAAVAFATAFALANWAAVQALDSELPGWAAPLVLAGAWLVLAGVLVAVLSRGSGESAGVSAWSLVAGGDEVVRDRELARDEAQQTVRERLEELAAGLADEAEARIASAVMPVAGSIVDAGEDILDASEEAIEDMVEEMPGGSLVGQAVDLVLLPGRWSLRVMTTALKGSSDGD